MAGAHHLKLVTGVESTPVRRRIPALEDYSPDDVALIDRALDWASPVLATKTSSGGEPALAHALGIADILAALKLDADCIAAGMLVQLGDTPDMLNSIRQRFGGAIEALADGVNRMRVIESLTQGAARPDADAAQLEGWRKMLLAMAQDLRVVLIKLADELQTLRFVVKSHDPNEGRVGARIALDIFAPLANRLGVWQLKWELEDLALRVLEPQTYKHIASLIDEKRAVRNHYIEGAISLLRQSVGQAGIQTEISGRAKHIYSIYKKMRRKGVGFDALYDVHALRILVNDVADCYAALDAVHGLWPPLANEFDDYIAKPKSNEYRSLHTAVTGPDGKPLEIQIRTFEMHRDAELGIAAHWRYKEGARKDAGYDRKIAWLRQMVRWKEELADTGHVNPRIQDDVFGDTIYVLTPEGRVIDLPHDATPIDFAYRVHTDLGHRCRGARVDGAMVPLNTPLRNGQRVEVIAAKQGGPSRDWLNPALGYLKGPGARGKVRQWFNRLNYEASITDGRAVLDKELQRNGMTGINLDELAHKFEFAKLNDFLAVVGRGELSPHQLQIALAADAPATVVPDAAPIVKKARAQPGGILVVGVDKLLTVPARCCKPAPPDAIVGFVSRGRGVTIHRKSCANVARLDSERLIAADWGYSADAMFAVDVLIEATDRTGLLRDITEILSRERLNVTATNSASRDSSARILLTVEIDNLEHLHRVLTLVKNVAGVSRAVRR